MTSQDPAMTPPQEIIYMRGKDGWLAAMTAPPGQTLSRSTLSEARTAIRAAVSAQQALDPGDVELHELVDAGESRYTRLH
jgi:hypothetical protein